MLSRVLNQIEELCQKLADDFLSGDHTSATQWFSYPLAVYLPKHIHLEVTRTDSVLAIGRRGVIARARGTEFIETKVLSVKDGEQGRTIIEVLWSFQDSRGREVDTTRLRYFAAILRDSIRIEMIEFLKLAFQETDPYSQGPPTLH